MQYDSVLMWSAKFKLLASYTSCVLHQLKVASIQWKLTITFISFKTSWTLEINGDTISRSKQFVI